MFVHICQQVKENCWNFIDSYGEICVHCGCCSEDPITRYTARIEVCERYLEEEKTHLNNKDYDERQLSNVKENIKYWEEKLADSKNKLKEAQDERARETSPTEEGD